MYLDRCRLLGIAVAVFSSTSQFAFGQSFPSRTITIIVPYPAGGPTDLIARTLGERVRQPLGQSVIVENVTGAGGTIGVGRATRATPDGHTLLIGNNGSNVLNAALYSLPFDIMNDLAPVARLTTNPQIIISKSAIPAKSLVELIAWLKQNQANVSVGIAGPIAHVNVINFQNSTIANTGSAHRRAETIVTLNSQRPGEDRGDAVVGVIAGDGQPFEPGELRQHICQRLRIDRPELAVP